MDVEEARAAYLDAADCAAWGFDDCHRVWGCTECSGCNWQYLVVEAASIALDLAVAEASRARIVAQVAY